jgi:hypothetical protein
MAPDFVIPNIAHPDPSLFADAELAHRLAAWGIAFLIVLQSRARSSIIS